MEPSIGSPSRRPANPSCEDRRRFGRPSPAVWVPDLLRFEQDRRGTGPRIPTSGVVRQTTGVGHDRIPFPLLAELPDALRDVILDFHWDLDRLHALQLPERELSLEELRWLLELPFWAVDGRPFRVTPASVAANPESHRDQWLRTMASDLRFPLDCYLGPGGRVTVLDGVHRLLKASVLGCRTVRVRIVSEADFDAIAVRAG